MRFLWYFIFIIFLMMRYWFNLNTILPFNLKPKKVQKLSICSIKISKITVGSKFVYYEKKHEQYHVRILKIIWFKTTIWKPLIFGNRPRIVDKNFNFISYFYQNFEFFRLTKKNRKKKLKIFVKKPQRKSKYGSKIQYLNKKRFTRYLSEFFAQIYFKFESHGMISKSCPRKIR